MQTREAELLFRPESDALRFLPEGPQACGEGQLSWVAIQHGGASSNGSLNILDLTTRTNTSYDLPGRPGFAFPCSRPGQFVVGQERELGLFDVTDGSWEPFCGEVDSDIDGTIINDGMVVPEGLIFGTKDLKFAERKAGLYFWRVADRTLLRWRSDQICSNGKAVCRRDDQLVLLDIDSPQKTVVAYPLDLAAGTLGEPQVVLDFREGSVFPDGMVLTPDGRSVIVAFYNPEDAEHGEARQYGISSGQVEAIWTTPGSPQVTCPQLVLHAGAVKLLLTTAVEHMPQDRQARHPNAGSLFIGDTPFTDLGQAACPLYAP